MAMSALESAQLSLGPAVTTAWAVGVGYGGAEVTTAGAAGPQVGFAQMDPIGTRGVGVATAGIDVPAAEVTTSGGGEMVAGTPSQSAGVQRRCFAPALVMARTGAREKGRRTARKGGSGAPACDLLCQDCCGRLCMYLLTVAAAALR